MDSTATTALVNAFRAQLVAALKAMPDVTAALEAMPDLGARARYLRAVLARMAQQADPLLAAAVAVAVAHTPADTLAPELAPKAGIVLSRHFNTKRRPETIERDGVAITVPAAVANLLREALGNNETDADRRIVAQMEAMLPELRGLLEPDERRKGSAKLRSVYRVNAALRARVTAR
jgi:hypothetical protein